MLGLNDLQAWLTANEILDPLINRMPESPPEAVVFSTVGGTAQIMDGAFEVQHIQVRSRALNDAAAETVAKQVHALINANPGSQQMGSTYVLSIEPQGVPVYLERDFEQRTTYACTYLVTTAT